MVQNTNLFIAKKEKTFGPILLKTLQVFNKIGPLTKCLFTINILTLVNVYVNLLVFMRIADTS